MICVWSIQWPDRTKGYAFSKPDLLGNVQGRGHTTCRLVSEIDLSVKIEYSYLSFTISPEVNTNTNQVVYRRIGPLIQESREQRTQWVDDKPDFNAAMWP